MRNLGEPLPSIEDNEKTKDKIVSVGLKQFALKGYTTVSMRDIAKAAGIRPSSIYNHFQSKEDLLNTILDLTIGILDSYYDMLVETNKKVNSFKEMANNLFLELKNVTNYEVYYGLNIAITTQYMNEKARYLIYDLLMLKSTKLVKAQFDDAIDRGLAAPFDTETMASFITTSVVMGNQLRVGTFNGYYQDFDLEKWYTNQERFVLDLAKRTNK